MLMFTLAISCVTMSNLPWLNITDSYAVLFFIASDFTFITRHIHSWASFPLWPSHFMLSGAISICPPLFPSSTLDTFWPVGLLFCVISFCLFMLSMGFLWQEYWRDLPFPPLVDHVLSELSTLSRPSWVALHGMAPSFTELCKHLHRSKAVAREASQVWQLRHLVVVVWGL